MSLSLSLSAGAALAAVYMSLVTGLRVDRFKAFTGALDLRYELHLVYLVSLT
jgi:ATP-dependent Lon protease